MTRGRETTQTTTSRLNAEGHEHVPLRLPRGTIDYGAGCQELIVSEVFVAIDSDVTTHERRKDHAGTQNGLRLRTGHGGFPAPSRIADSCVPAQWAGPMKGL